MSKPVKKEYSQQANLSRFSQNGPTDHKWLFGNSNKMMAIGKTIDQIADTDIPVLISGESGTGKELVANAIHLCSLRKNNPLVKVSCVAIPSELLESELFGYEKGAFTGAYQSKPGRFEFAHKGTIFLDEIGDMPMPLQAKLLRVLQEGEFFHLGGRDEIKVDVRLISASNRDLEKVVKEGIFREDLLYRLNVIKIWIPPLRERKEEIPTLVDYFLEKYCQEYNKGIVRLSRKTLKSIENYHWPGNVRELENIIKKIIVLEDEEIAVKEFSAKESDKKKKEFIDNQNDDEFEGYSLKEISKKAASDVEKKAIKRVLEKTRWNRREAAEILKISYKALLYKIRDNGLDRWKGD
ncbi:MAG: sigma-54 dependent transcriptional regulator [Thermodesulfobacteriota bacterium]|nr:sigma-54 dependent transcriptional regulator [Thermodesulfobacteriota bacterium]